MVHHIQPSSGVYISVGPPSSEINTFPLPSIFTGTPHTPFIDAQAAPIKTFFSSISLCLSSTLLFLSLFILSYTPPPPNDVSWYPSGRGEGHFSMYTPPEFHACNTWSRSEKVGPGQSMQTSRPVPTFSFLWRFKCMRFKSLFFFYQSYQHYEYGFRVTSVFSFKRPAFQNCDHSAPRQSPWSPHSRIDYVHVNWVNIEF